VEMHANGGGLARLTSGLTVEVGRRFVPTLRERLS